MLKIVTDGSCRGNPGPTGWAAVLVRDEEILEELQGGSLDSGTNNIAEMTAIRFGLIYAKAHMLPGEPITVVTDSELCIGYLAGGWRSRNAVLGRLRLSIRKEEKALGVQVVYQKGGIEDELFQLVDVLSKEAVPV
jgi:ribonuclease HI